MPKDQNGAFHPGTGKPSGANKEEGLGLQATDPEKLTNTLTSPKNIRRAKISLHPAFHLKHLPEQQR